MISVDDTYVAFLEKRRAQILNRVERAAVEAGRDPFDVTVCAVSKTVGVEEVVAAKRAGYTAFAENRPQELARKVSVLRDEGELDGTSWHMIGNLQKNKINLVLGTRPYLVHSVASLDLAQAISAKAQAAGVRQAVLIEVNVSGEATKSGVSPSQLRAAADEWLAVGEALDVRGFMTMAPAGDPGAAHETFSGLRELANELAPQLCVVGKAELSMGMSEDFEEAIRQGATIIRLGRVVFDPRFEFE